MLIVVLVYCLGTQPDRCIERHPANADLMPIACAALAERVAASEEERLEVAHLYPGYRLASFGCRRPADLRTPA